jgi:hypothetical protein
MNKKILILFALVAALQCTFAQQTIELDFPKLSERTAWLYYFSGSRVDSFSVKLDSNGKAVVETDNYPSLQGKDYRGMGYLYIPEAGGGEFILAEPRLHISCQEDGFNAQMLDFGQSVENAFLQKIFTRRASLLGRQEWLQNGFYFPVYEEDKIFSETLSTMIEDNENALKAFDESIAASPLYAARFMELTLFMQRLYAAVQKPDAETQRKLRNEFQYKLDIAALYHSGNLWTDVHTYYGGLFISGSNEENNAAYAASVDKTMMRLQEPVKTAFLSSTIAACERNNRLQAAETIIKDFVQNYPDLSPDDSNLQRLLNIYRVGKGSNAPALVGLDKTIEQPALLVFFDSDCDPCKNEINWLTENYEKIKSKGYRIVSIAADTRTNNYMNAAAGLPWSKTDKLCDFEGYKGENFRNYGVIGTPTIFELDENGIVMGRYAQMKEIVEKTAQK